jgi:hypothetical protein
MMHPRKRINNCRPIIEPILNWMQLPDKTRMQILRVKE